MCRRKHENRTFSGQVNVNCLDGRAIVNKAFSINPIFQTTQHFNGSAIPSGAGEENRTPDQSLENSRFATKLRPR